MNCLSLTNFDPLCVTNIIGNLRRYKLSLCQEQTTSRYPRYTNKIRIIEEMVLFLGNRSFIIINSKKEPFYHWELGLAPSLLCSQLAHLGLLLFTICNSCIFLCIFFLYCQVNITYRWWTLSSSKALVLLQFIFSV